MKLSLLLLLIFSFSAFTSDYMKHEIEDEKQTSFPGIQINGHTVTGLHSISLDGESSNYKFVKSAELKKGTTLKISSYIISKDILDSMSIKSVSSKTTRAELKAALDSQDEKALTDFVLKMAEKRRPPTNNQEQKELEKIIQKNKTEDDSGSTPYFETGFIEALPADDSDIRYFVPLNQLKSISIDAKKGKIVLMQSLTLLAFKKLRSNINFGDLSDAETASLKQVEETLTSACNKDCIMKNQASLSNLVLGVIELASHDFFSNFDGDSKSMNAKVTLGHVCLMQRYFEACPEDGLKQKIQMLLKKPEAQKLISKHSGVLSKACLEEFR